MALVPIQYIETANEIFIEHEYILNLDSLNRLEIEANENKVENLNAVISNTDSLNLESSELISLLNTDLGNKQLEINKYKRRLKLTKLTALVLLIIALIT